MFSQVDGHDTRIAVFCKHISITETIIFTVKRLTGLIALFKYTGVDMPK